MIPNHNVGWEIISAPWKITQFHRKSQKIMMSKINVFVHLEQWPTDKHNN